MTSWGDRPTGRDATTVTHRHIHYEGAFEDLLRQRRTPYVAVDEAKRALFAEADIKSLDFIVYVDSGPNLLVDVKGRQFPYEGRSGTRYWENWSTRDDLDGLDAWQQIFGEGFASVLVFAYHIHRSADQAKFATRHTFRDSVYGLVGVRVGDYRQHMRTRSPSWQTVSLPTRVFRRVAQPLDLFLGAPLENAGGIS